VKSICSIMYLV